MKTRKRKQKGGGFHDLGTGWKEFLTAPSSPVAIPGVPQVSIQNRNKLGSQIRGKNGSQIVGQNRGKIGSQIVGQNRGKIGGKNGITISRQNRGKIGGSWSTVWNQVFAPAVLVAMNQLTKTKRNYKTKHKKN
jgi:hypothetical protein